MAVRGSLQGRRSLHRPYCVAFDRQEQDDLPVEIRLAEAMCAWFLAHTQINLAQQPIAPSAVEALERAARFFARPEKAAALRAPGRARN
jgi:hypothetical protein